MILSAGQLSTFQRCPRQWLLNQSGEIRRWRPRSLFTSLFRAAVKRLSNGDDLAAVTGEACARYMETAAKPGLETTGSPYILARDYSSVLKTSLARVHACVEPSLQDAGAVILPGEHRWRVGALINKARNRLYAWDVVDSLNDAMLSRELHSWFVFGDCAATGLPMTLTILEIGRQGGDHLHTPWCRAFRHPAIAGRFAFQQKDGQRLKGDWKPVWYQDSLRNDPKTWLALMERDHVQAIKEVPVKQLSPEQAKEGLVQISQEAGEMEKLADTNWRQVPMRRGSCDLPPCGWQGACYRPG